MRIERKKTILGVFVLGGILLGVFFVVLFGKGNFFQRSHKFILFFDNSVKGLNIGSPVLFRGVKVGRVTDIQLRADPRNMKVKLPVIIELYPDRVDWTSDRPQPQRIFETMTERGLRAQLILQSFVTGSCVIGLDFFPEAGQRESDFDEKYPVIPTKASSFQELAETVERLPLDDLANKLISALEGIEKFINSPTIPSTLSSMDQTMQDLQVTVQGLEESIPSLTVSLEETLQDIQELAQNADEQISLAGSGFNATQTRTNLLIRNLDQEIKSVSAEIKSTAKKMQKAVNRIEEALSLKKGGALFRLTSGLETTFAAIESTFKQTEESLAALQEATDKDSALRYELSQTLQELSAAARSIRNLTDYLERHPEALIKGKQGY
ncbi:MAG: MlaD family protein [Desulfohalobiaceae bacterium]|nr:MlaD family protein [Desulfohalobiaceae bacterium]